MIKNIFKKFLNKNIKVSLSASIEIGEDKNSERKIVKPLIFYNEDYKERK